VLRIDAGMTGVVVAPPLLRRPVAGCLFRGRSTGVSIDPPKQAAGAGGCRCVTAGAPVAGRDAAGAEPRRMQAAGRPGPLQLQSRHEQFSIHPGQAGRIFSRTCRAAGRWD